MKRICFVFLIMILLLPQLGYADRVTINFRQGWNMFSLPVNKITTKDELLRGCSVKSPVYHYNTIERKYEIKDSIEPGYGYWIYLDSSCSINVDGDAVNLENIIDLKFGWNQISSISTPIEFQSIKGSCDVKGGPWRYNPLTRMYEFASILEPGYGYWVYVSGECRLGVISSPEIKRMIFEGGGDTAFIASKADMHMSHFEQGWRVPQIHTINSNVISLLYRNIRAVYGNAAEYQSFVNSGWILKNSTGQPVTSTVFNYYIVDVGNPEYQQWVANWMKNYLDQYGYNGVFLDNCLPSTEIFWSTSSTPINPRTGNPWTSIELKLAVISIVNKTKEAIGNKLVVGNGILYGDRFFNNIYNQGYVDLLTKSKIDGIESEAWIMDTETKQWYSEDRWNKSINFVVWLENNFLNKDLNKVFLPVAQNIAPYDGGGEKLPAGATKEQYALYTYASLALAFSSNTSYLNFGYYSDGYADNLFGIKLGSPVGKHYMIQGTHVYARNFTDSKVLVNPTSNDYTINLGVDYKKLDGTIVSSITMSAHTGEILFRTAPRKCSDGTLYGRCSSTKPKYCDNGILIDKCSSCGCSSWNCQSDGSCKQTTPNCDSTCKAQSFASGICRGDATSTGMLHACGTKLCDENNNEIVLRGTQYDWNAMGKHDDASPTGAWFNLSDVQRIKSNGGTVLELHMMPISKMMPTKGSVNVSWFNEKLDKYVSWCEQTKLYCIISLPSIELNYAPIPSWLFNGETPNQASIDFWNISNTLFESNRQAIIQLFQFIADRYKNNKTVIFGLINEPFMGNSLVNGGNAAQLSVSYARLVERIIDAIRSTGAQQPIFVDKPYVWFSTDLSHYERVNRNNIVWEDHAYANVGGKWSTSLTAWKNIISTYVQTYVSTFSKPFYVGEYGVLEYSTTFDSNMEWDKTPYWKENLTGEVNFLKTLPLAGYAWHEYPSLDGEWYDYYYTTQGYDYFTPQESDWILQTVLGGSTPGSCQLGETSIGQDSCSSGNLCCCLQKTTCTSCNGWINGACNAGGCVNKRQQTRICTPTGCAPSDGQGTSRCISDSSCGALCGNNIIEGTEQCDGTNLNGKTCASLGYIGGTLKCTNCFFDTSGCTGGAQFRVTVDTSKVIGSNNFSIGFMTDWSWPSFVSNSVTRQLVNDADFKLVRVFDFRTTSPKLMPCNSWDVAKNNCTSWDWTQVDLFTQRVFEIGAEPIFTLGWATSTNMQNYIPPGMQLNSTTGLPNLVSYAVYASEWVKHFKQKGWLVRYYEIMNEPSAYFGWNPSPSNSLKLSYYVDLWNFVARAMRQQNSDILLSQDAITQTNVFNYWLLHGDDVDYLDFHKYDCGTWNKSSSSYYSDEKLFGLAESSHYETGGSFYGVKESQQKWLASRGKLLPVINSESNLNSAWEGGTDPRLQQMTGAVWKALELRKAILSGAIYSVYYEFSSSSTTNAQSGGHGFGMINSYSNKPWYPYYVQKWIGNNLDLGDNLIQSTSSSSNIRTLSWVNNGKLNILIIHNSTISETVSLIGVTGQLNYSKIDDPSGTNYLMNPVVQTGMIDASSIITMNGYTVMLLQTTTTQSSCDSQCKAQGFNSGICRAGSSSVLPSPTAFNTIANARDGTGGKAFHTHNSLINMFKTLFDQYPGYASYESIGKTYEGRDIVLFKIGNPNGGKVLWDGAVHGWEDVGSEVEYLISKWLLENGTTGIDPTAQRIIQQNLILFVPVINMDSYERQNRNFTSCSYGVDLNRNFVYGWNAASCGNMNYPGPSSASEKETQAMRSVFQTYKPNFYLNTHYGGGQYMSSAGSTSVETQLIQSIRQISTQRGVTPYTMSTGGSGGAGQAYSDAKQLGALSSWFIEINNDNYYLNGTSRTSSCPCYGHTCDTYQDVVNAAYPRMLPIFIAMANASAVTPSITCQSGESSIGQDGCSSGLCCCKQAIACTSCGGWTNTSCGAGSCSSSLMQQTRTCTPTGCTPTDGLGLTRCIPDTYCGALCGNNIIEGSEQCDGTNLNGKTCASLGYTGGTLKCTNCFFDTSGCTGGAQFRVTVDTSKVIGNNKLQIGTQVDYGNTIAINALRQSLMKNASIVLVRSFDWYIGYPNSQACTHWDDATKTGTFNWQYVDQFVDSVFSAGAEPMIVLGFADTSGNGIAHLPNGMGYNSTTLLPNPDEWASYATYWINHFASTGKPVRFYQIVNEPFMYLGWTPNAARLAYYASFYNKTYNAMKSLNSNLIISQDFDTQQTVLDYFINSNVKIDAIDYHKYDSGTANTSSPSYETDSKLFRDAETQYFTNGNPFTRSVSNAQAYYKTKTGRDIIIINSEGNLNSAWNGGTDSRNVKMSGTVWDALKIRMEILNNVSYDVHFTFMGSKSFETSKTPFGGYGFGMIDSDSNKPYYPYWLYFMIFNNLDVGDNLIQSTSTSSNIRTLSWVNNGKLNILIIHNSTATETFSLNGVTGQLNYSKIDDPSGTNYLMNPVVQTGMIDASSIITMNGYTVMLLQQSSTIQKCPDGTAYGSCSNINKPSWCDSSGNLVSNQCGSTRHNCPCPTGQTCQSDGTCKSVVPTGTIWGANLYVPKFSDGNPSGYAATYLSNTVFQAAKDMGITHIILWQKNFNEGVNNVKPAPTITQAQMVDAVSRMKNYGLQPIIVLDYNVTDAVALVTALGSGCTMYEICKEPHVTGSSCYADEATYASRWNEVVSACRKVNPNAMYGGPAVGTIPGTSPRSEAWMRKWLEQCDGDFVSVHAFYDPVDSKSNVISRARTETIADVAYLKGILADYGKQNLPIVYSEVQWTSTVTTNGWDMDQSFNDNFTGNLMSTMEEQNVYAATFWTLIGFDNNFAIIRPPSQSYEKKPQYYSIQDYLAHINKTEVDNSLVYSLPSIPSDVWAEWRSRTEKENLWKNLWNSHGLGSKIHVAGKSEQNKDIYLFEVGNPNAPALFVDAEMHGNEDHPNELLLRFAYWLLNGEDNGNITAQRIMQNNRLLFMPIVDTDLSDKSSTNTFRRNNVNGVNLNRNFEYNWQSSTDPEKGPSAASESETQTVKNVFVTYKPRVYMNLHVGAFMARAYGNSTLSNQIISNTPTFSSYFNSVYGGTHFGAGYSSSDAVDDSPGVSSWLIEFFVQDETKTEYNGWMHDSTSLDILENRYYPKFEEMLIGTLRAIE